MPSTALTTSSIEVGQWLAEETGRLERAHPPAGRRHAADCLKRIFASFGPSRATAIDGASAEAYVAVLADFPAAVLDAVAADVCNGRVDGLNPDWAPSAPRLAQLCRERTQELRDRLLAEGWQARQAALPPPAPERPEPNEATRTVVAAKAQALIAGIAEDAAMAGAAERARREEARRRQADEAAAREARVAADIAARRARNAADASEPVEPEEVGVSLATR